MLKGINPSIYGFSEHQIPNLVPAEYNNDTIDEVIFGSDEFRMYAYKIKRCPRMRSHDWTECPYAHRGEKAQRRDPRKFIYSAIACPAFRNGKCLKGDACEFAHGVFEYWLHPARYRTRACNAGRYCQRKVCFFAHTPEQLRSETKYKCHYTYRPRMINGGDDGVRDGSNVPEKATSVPVQNVDLQRCCCDGVSEFLKSLRSLKIRDFEEGGRSSNWELSDSDLPQIDWISDLVQ
ncbi:zinc finger CCCH domain-containing protein 54 [Fagus crenata]